VQENVNNYGGGLNQSLLHPLVAVAMILTILLALFLPRRYVIFPLLFSTILIPLPQQLYIGGAHVFVFRILILFGCIRMLWTKLSEKTPILAGGWNVVDYLFLCEVLFHSFASLATFHFASGEIVYQVGSLWDLLGGYFLVRFLIQDEDDLFMTIKAFVPIVTVLSVTMLGERIIHQNVIGYLGGIPIGIDIREGSIRAHGSFAVSITAGVFGATLLCLFVLLWKSGRSKLLAAVGIIGCTIITITSASSTPLLGYLGGILAICFWPMRKLMRPFRWGIVIALIGIHLIMKAPVWFLIAHVDMVAGNSGYHRAMLIDTFVRHFWDWWLIGTNAMLSWGIDMWDLSNQFVAEGETGGLVTFICFIMLISKSFGRIGTARKIVQGDTKKEWLFWLLGATLFAHCVSYFGISYFDQIKIAWFALLAMISAATAPVLAAETVPDLGKKVTLRPLRAGFAKPAPTVANRERELVRRVTTR
jgi:hypothetical protein